MLFLKTAVVAILLGSIVSLAFAETDSINADSFGCIRDMTPVRGLYIDNLEGAIEATLEVAQSEKGGLYPLGSVVQLVPKEVMVKRQTGFNPATNDWEFFALDVSPEGTSIRTRGFKDVVNQSGGNCFACHVKARPNWDFICEIDHGCDPISITPVMIKAIQKSDPRCPPAELTTEEANALQALQEKK